MSKDVLIAQKSPFFAAMKMLGRGNPEDAVTLTSDLLIAHPADAQGHFLLAVALGRCGRASGAEQEYREAIRCDGSLLGAYANLGNNLVKDKRPIEAEDVLRPAIARAPDDAMLHCGMGRAYAAQLRFDAASDEYAQAIRLEPGYAPAHVDMGRLLVTQHDFHSAIREYNDALKADPNCLTAFVGLTTALSNLGRYGTAVDVYERAIALHPTHSGLKSGCGCALAVEAIRHTSLPQCDKALELMDAALLLSPDDLPTMKMRTRMAQWRTVRVWSDGLWRRKLAYVVCITAMAIAAAALWAAARLHG